MPKRIIRRGQLSRRVVGIGVDDISIRIGHCDQPAHIVIRILRGSSKSICNCNLMAARVILIGSDNVPQVVFILRFARVII